MADSITVGKFTRQETDRFSKVRKIKIFITGIAGALGSQLAGEFLERGHTVEGCDIKREA